MNVTERAMKNEEQQKQTPEVSMKTVVLPNTTLSLQT